MMTRNLDMIIKNGKMNTLFIEVNRNFNFDEIGTTFVIDIESCGIKNNSECLVYSVAIMCVDNDDDISYVFRCVGDFMNSVLKSKEDLKFYVHNLSFDIKPFLLHFIDNMEGKRITKTVYEKTMRSYIDNEKYTLNILNENHQKDMDEFTYDALIKENSFYKCRMRGNYGVIEFLDTYKLFPFSLKKCSKELIKLILPKEDLDYTKERKLFETLEYNEKRYIYNDVYSLKYLVKTYCQDGITISDRFIKFDKLTISGQTFSNFKEFLHEDYLNKENCFENDDVYDLVDNKLYMTNYYNQKSEKNKQQLVFEAMFPKLNFFTDSFLRKSYYGGLSYVERDNCKKYEKMVDKTGNVYDVNSLYPFTMETFPLPYGQPIFNKKPYKNMSENFKSKYPLYVQEITVYKLDVKKNKINFLQVKHNKHFNGTECIKNNIVNGKRIPIQLTLTNVTLDLLFECYDVKAYKLGGHMAFQQTHGIFNSYLSFWKKVKIENEGALRFIAKLFQNSLYGRFGMRGTSDIVYADSDNGKFVIDYDIKDVVGDAIYLPIATFITSYAKRYLCNAINSNYKNFMYCDTDSIHLIGSEVNGITLHKKKYGAWDNEMTFTDAKYLGQKRYCEKNIKNGKWEIKCCGLNDSIMKQVDDIQMFDNCVHSSNELKNMKLYTKDDSIYYYYDKECSKKIVGLFKSKKAKQVKGGTLILEIPYMLSNSFYNVMR